MKKLLAVLFAAAGLSGCAVVPVADPGVYYGPSVVVRPAYTYGYRHHRPRGHWRHGHR
jgi:hypothetical protein